MSFVVEDGTRPADANAYITTAFFDSYHADRGHASVASLSSQVKQQCIVRATDYIDKRFGRRFRGMRISNSQSLEWPRLDAYDNNNFLLAGINSIPPKLKRACAEYALRAAVYSELAPDPLMTLPTQDFTGVTIPSVPVSQGPGLIAETSEQVDVITETIRYQSLAQRNGVVPGKEITSALVSPGNIPEYPAADMLLEELLRIGKRTLLRG